MTDRIDQLIALFNSRSMDLPDGLFSRHTQFLLNGVPFENMLGRPPDDPLVLMLARGPAGYRFTLKAVQHAVPDAQAQRGVLEQSEAEGRTTVKGQCWVSGHFRGTQEAAELLLSFALIARGETVERIDVALDDHTLARLKEARLRA